jgi:hypothetical protein
VELAGSEALSHQQDGTSSGATSSANEAAREAIRARKSLIALGEVLMALSHRQTHIGYRNSKLTFALQDCLSRDTNVFLFTTVHPGLEHYHESLKSLLFASRVKSIHVSLDGVDPHMSVSASEKKKKGKSEVGDVQIASIDLSPQVVRAANVK